MSRISWLVLIILAVVTFSLCSHDKRRPLHHSSIPEKKNLQFRSSNGQEESASTFTVLIKKNKSFSPEPTGTTQKKDTSKARTKFNRKDYTPDETTRKDSTYFKEGKIRISYKPAKK